MSKEVLKEDKLQRVLLWISFLVAIIIAFFAFFKAYYYMASVNLFIAWAAQYYLGHMKKKQKVAIDVRSEQ